MFIVSLMQGRITCANVLSDLYAMGVVECDNMLMILGVSRDLSDIERDIVIPMIMQGFKVCSNIIGNIIRLLTQECAQEAGTSIQGGQTIRSAWLTLGGVATSVCHRSEFIMPDAARVDDVLVLTKPIGTQVAVNCYEWLKTKPDRWSDVSHVIDERETRRAFARAVDTMCRLNRTGMILFQYSITYYFSCTIDAQIQCTCMHRCHRFRHSRSRT